MIKYNDIQQQTDEWYAIKKGKMSASHAQAIGNCGKGLDTYVIEVLANKYEIKPDEPYSNTDIDRGNLLEAEARQAYADETKNEVRATGFVENDKYTNIGCSPDGLVGEDGLIEIKCPNNINYFNTLISPNVKSDYMWQIQMQLLITEREWCDYVVYNPNFKKSLLVLRVFPNKEMQDKLIEGFNIGNKKIDELINFLDK